MFKMITLVALLYCLGAFPPISWPVFDIPARLAQCSFWTRVHSLSPLFSLLCLNSNGMNVQRKECVFVTHTLQQKAWVNGAKRAKLPTRSPACCAVELSKNLLSYFPAVSRYLSPYLCPFDLHFSTNIFLPIFLCSRKSNQAGSVLAKTIEGREISFGRHFTRLNVLRII